MEEDIKILEEQLNIYKRHLENCEKEDCLTSVYYELKKYATAIENLIKGYRELEEENESLVRQYEYQGALMVNEYFSKEEVFELFIPKSKIKEQLDKLDLDYEEQESWDELSGSTAVTLFCKKLLKG